MHSVKLGSLSFLVGLLGTGKDSEVRVEIFPRVTQVNYWGSVTAFMLGTLSG